MLAAGQGITLTAADTVVFAEMSVTPGIMLQAEDRAHRIGQRSSVNIHYLVAKGTIDEEIWRMIGNKLGVLGQQALTRKPQTANRKLQTAHLKP